jgi:hypothetical protein
MLLISPINVWRDFLIPSWDLRNMFDPLTPDAWHGFTLQPMTQDLLRKYMPQNIHYYFRFVPVRGITLSSEETRYEYAPWGSFTMRELKINDLEIRCTACPRIRRKDMSVSDTLDEIYKQRWLKADHKALAEILIEQVYLLHDVSSPEEAAVLLQKIFVHSDLATQSQFSRKLTAIAENLKGYKKYNEAFVEALRREFETINPVPSVEMPPLASHIARHVEARTKPAAERLPAI